MSKLNDTLVSKRFIIRKSLIGKNINVSFTDYDGKVHKYSHDKVYELCKERFDNMKCFQKYKYYSQTFALPKFVRELGDEVLVKQNFSPSGGFTDNDGRIPTLSPVLNNKNMNKLYQELQLIDEFEANFNPTNQSKKRKLEILGKLKTNLSANKTNELLREYNELQLLQ